MNNAKVIIVMPAHNVEKIIPKTIEDVRSVCDADILVVDDGSSDGTARRLAAFNQRVHVVTHQKNQGYGAALRTAFQFASDGDYDVLVTIDCDGQHEPQRISEFVAACRDTSDGRLVDIVSGSRYLKNFY